MKALAFLLKCLHGFSFCSKCSDQLLITTFRSKCTPYRESIGREALGCSMTAILCVLSLEFVSIFEIAKQ